MTKVGRGIDARLSDPLRVAAVPVISFDTILRLSYITSV